MGKRELLIATAFVFLGFAVYRFTAPPGNPNDPGFSPSRIIDQIRREIRGQRASAEINSTTNRPVTPSIVEVRVAITGGPVTIIGEDRQDIEAEFHVRSNGYDNAEAERLAKESELKFDDAGAVMIITTHFPQGGRQTATVQLKVPARLGIRIDEKSSTLEISNVASVLIGSGRGRTTIQHVAGLVNVNQRGSQVAITDVGSLKFSASYGAEARIAQVHGDALFTTQTGEVRAQELEGALEIESRNTEMQFDRIEKLKGPVRVNAQQGEVVLIGLRVEARIEGRRTDIRVDHLGGAPLSIYNEGDEVIDLTVPSSGFTLDAVALEGRINLDAKLEKEGLKVATSGGADGSSDGQESRVAGRVHGGGPAITLRSKRGDIVVRPH